MQLLDTQTPLLNTQGVTLHVTREMILETGVSLKID